METELKPAEVVEKLDEKEFAAEITQKLKDLKLEDDETAPKDKMSMRKSFTNFFSFKDKSLGSHEVASSSSFSFSNIRKSSFNTLNKLFGKKEKECKEVEEHEAGQQTTNKRSSLKWIKRLSSSKLKPINEEALKF